MKLKEEMGKQKADLDKALKVSRQAVNENIKLKQRI